MTVLALHWLGWVELIASIGSSLYLVILFYKYRDFTFDKDRNFTYTYIVIPVCILASVVFHPGFFEEGFDFPSMMIACGNYMEAMALIPQLQRMRKDGTVRKELSLYITLLAVSRFCRIVFWILLIYLEGGYFFTIILSDVVYIVQVADLIYYFIKHKGTYIIPT